MMNLGRAKKKLRYFQSETSAPCQLKIKDVFSMKDLDQIFDDIDSEPGTPLLSPLPRSPALDEQNRGSQSPVTKSLVPFAGEISPLKCSDALAAESEIQLDHLNNKGSPLEEIAPIKTSSPIELLAVRNVSEDAEKSDTSPLLFVIEDEEPVVGDLSKPQMNQMSESPKDISHGDSESLVSPPAQFKLGKPTKQKDSVTSSTPQKAPEAPDPVCKPPALEPEKELRTEESSGGVSLSPVVLIQKRQPEPPPKEQPIKQVQDTAVEAGVKQSLFQTKLRNSLQPKASGFRKQETLKQPARAPSPHVPDEDFMILEDDCPIRFTIPRKPESKDKPAPESVSAEQRSKEDASPKQNEEDENQKKRKAKHRNNTDDASKDTAVLSSPEEREDEVDVGPGGGEPARLSPDTNQDTDLPAIKPLGKKIPKGKFPKSKQQLSKNAKDVGVKISAKTKKPAKLSGGTNTALEEPLSLVTKKPSKIKPAVKECVPEPIGLSSVKPKKRRSAAKNKKQAKEQEPEAEVQTSPPTEQLEVQSRNTVKKANKAPQQVAPKKPQKVKKTFGTAAFCPESDVSAEPATSKRKRKPPGDWWLTQASENNTQEQLEAVGSSQVLKSKQKSQKKAPVPAESPEHETATTFQKMPRKLKKPQASKSQSNLAGLRKNPKSAGGRRKSKAGAQDQCDMTPAPVEEEERDIEASGQFSPVNCGPRQRSVTPGNKRVFDKIYTREGPSGSAQKCPPELPGELDSVPVKRRRKPLRNWWEVQQSQEPVKRTSSPLPSRQQMRSPLHQISSLQKTRGLCRKTAQTINTPKSVKSSLATFNAIYNSGKPDRLTERAREVGQKGRRNLLHSLEDQSEQSSESTRNDYQQQASSNATFDVCVSGIVSESSAAWRKSNPRASASSVNKALEFDNGFKSGPSSLIELERYEEHEDAELPSSRIVPQPQITPRVLSDCALCGPPLKPIVLDNEDWDNLCVWFAHIWPNTSKDSKSISPDDFHWHCHAGRAMGHMVDLQNNAFSSGKILLGSYMKKPAQVDLNAITVFNVASSCVRVEIDGVKETYSSGQTFMTPCGQSYSIHNMFQEPAVLWYHRMLQGHTAN